MFDDEEYSPTDLLAGIRLVFRYHRHLKSVRNQSATASRGANMLACREVNRDLLGRYDSGPWGYVCAWDGAGGCNTPS